jgi:hypothetical protein
MVKPWNQANCYGYAVDINRWFVFDDAYEYAVDELLDKNPSWRLVDRKDMVLGKSYVSFRYGYHDFHFMFRDHRGHWTHKQGGQRVATISQKEVFEKHWVNPTGTLYTSKVYLFEVPNR